MAKDRTLTILKDADLGNCEIPKFRQLNPGESYQFKELGLDSVYLSGEGVRIAVWPDGRETLVMPAKKELQRIKEFVFCELVTLGRSFRADEIKYVRKFLGLSQEQFAELLDVNRVTESRYETGEPISRVVTMAVQRICLEKMLRIVNNWTDDIRRLNAKYIEQIQQWLVQSDDMVLKLNEDYVVDLVKTDEDRYEYLNSDVS